MVDSSYYNFSDSRGAEKTMIPADILGQLRESDPELWGEYISSPAYIYDHSDKYKEAWLQYCLQEAIRVRGWHISQSVMCWGREQPYYAAIRKSEYEPWAGETGDTEAEALMRAYLSALSGERI